MIKLNLDQEKCARCNALVSKIQVERCHCCYKWVCPKCRKLDRLGWICESCRVDGGNEDHYG